MEFHLVARPGATQRDIEALVESRGMKVKGSCKKPDEAWGLLFASRTWNKPVSRP
jgi:hypothetical protein